MHTVSHIFTLFPAAPKLVGNQDTYSTGVQSAVTEVNAAAEKSSKALVAVGNEKMLVPKKAPTMPKPQWHAPWKLYRVCLPLLPHGKKWTLTIS